MSLNLFQVLPPTFIQESLATRTLYYNLDVLYKLDNEVRLTLLDLIRLRKLNFFHGIAYAFGHGSEGSLGTGYYDDENYCYPIPIDTTNIDDRRVIQVSAGAGHSLVLCEDGTVFSFGNNEFGQLGITTNNFYVVSPTPIDTSMIIDIDGRRKRIIQVSAGVGHSLVLCKDGSVYSFGWNAFGQLGTGDIDTESSTPTPINTFKMGDRKVIQVSAGYHYSLLLCEDGTVYSFGFGRDGRLGIDDEYLVEIPTPINTSNMGEKKVIQVSADGFHSLLLCEDGSVYSFGDNEYGQLGTGDMLDKAIPTPIDATNFGGKRIIQVSAGGEHSLFLCNDGSVYAVGNGEDGRLGDNIYDEHNIEIPTQIDTSRIVNKNGRVKRVIKISAGGEHSLLLYRDGTVYSFGNNDYCQLGAGDDYNYDVEEPLLIDTSELYEKKVIDISAGNTHSLILT